MLHRIWQVHHVLPHEVYALDRSQKVFLYASEELAAEAEEKQRKKAERKQQAPNNRGRRS